MQTAQDIHTLTHFIELSARLLIEDKLTSPEIRKAAEALSVKCLELCKSSLTEANARQLGLI